MGIREVVNYFIYLRDKSKLYGQNRSLTNMKLQLLIYFAYALYAIKTKNNEKLFCNADIEAGRYGPFISFVYYKFHVYGQSEIPTSKGGSYDCLNEEAKIVIEEIWNTLSDTSTYDLVEISQAKNSPWHNVYEEGKRNVIPHESIVSYFGGR